MTAASTVKTLVISVVLVAIAMAGFGCATSFQKIDQIDPTTAQIEATIKAALIDAEAVDAAAILVKVINENKVNLSGFVGSEDESQEAERLAKEAQPGLQVLNELTVRN